MSCALIISFVGFELRLERLLREELLLQAQAFVEEVVATRAVIAGHGGVYVPASAETTVNPYLTAIPGIETHITGSDGRVYVLRNPALFTAAISDELGTRAGSRVRFRMTSLRPINPDNAADEFERESLSAFEFGGTERYDFREREGIPVFTYVSPLKTESSCLTCHRGETVGSIRGGVTVDIDASLYQSQVKGSRTLVGIALGLALFIVLGVLDFVFRRLFRRLMDAQRTLEEMASTDVLTGLVSRRKGLEILAGEVSRVRREGGSLAVLMADLDGFKAVNDTFGHHAGDEVLRRTARALESGARDYDTVARVGGEEFLVVLPGAHEEQAFEVAERMREAVASEVLPTTISIGIAAYEPTQDPAVDELLKAADRSLYAAKRAGGNRCVLHSADCHPESAGLPSEQPQDEPEV